MQKPGNNKGKSWHTWRTEGRQLPNDEQGRLRHIDSEGFIIVHVGMDHPLCCGCGHIREHRLKMFEAGKLLPGQRVYFKDGNRLNTALDNLVAADVGDHRPGTVLEWPCACGCGQMIQRGQNGKPFYSKMPKYLKGHWKLRDAFSELPLTRQRQKQLRNIANGLCSNCGRVREGHPRLCPVHLAEYESKKESKRIKWAQRYMDDPNYRASQEKYRSNNETRAKAYVTLRAEFGKKCFWPEEVRRQWNMKYPTAGQKRLLDLGIRYDRM